jgi:glycosyltransferase involved in cell wall biosynthesis
MTKYLARLGYDVTVLTSAVSGQGPIDGAVRVVRAYDLMVSRLNWRRGHFKALRGEQQATYDPTPSALSRLIVPEVSLVGWLPFALPRAIALARRSRFDCVITSSPGETTHLIGMALKRRGIPWIAELRDGWRFESTHPDWPYRLQHRIDSSLERAVVTRADALVTVTEPISADLRERYGVDVATITNGFDPEEQPSAASELVSVDRFSLVHTGRMAVAGRSPQSLIEAIELLARDRPELANRLEVLFAGPLTEDERELFSQPSLDGIVRSVGTLDRTSTLALQRSADGLLVITGRSRRSEATGKLFEYLATGRPLLVLGDQAEAGRIVLDAGAGVVSADRPTDVARSLVGLIEGAAGSTGNGAGGGRATERYAYPSLARRMAEQIEQIQP